MERLLKLARMSADLGDIQSRLAIRRGRSEPTTRHVCRPPPQYYRCHLATLLPADRYMPDTSTELVVSACHGVRRVSAAAKRRRYAMDSAHHWPRLESGKIAQGVRSVRPTC